MLLTEEQILIRDTARAFAQEKVAPHVRAWEAAGEIPRALLREMGELGFMGMCVPAEWGRSEEHTSELQSHRDLHPFPTRRSSDLPHVRAWEAAGEIPRALLREMGELGFMGMCVPAEWG